MLYDKYKMPWCYECGSKSLSPICDDCVAAKTAVKQCWECQKSCIGSNYCSELCRQRHRHKKAASIAKPLIDWVKQKYVKPAIDIQRLFENGLTEWLGTPFWFPVKEIHEETGCDKKIINEILVRHFGRVTDVIRFANSDGWTLMDPDLAPILHAYLGKKFMPIFDELSL